MIFGDSVESWAFPPSIVYADFVGCKTLGKTAGFIAALARDCRNLFHLSLHYSVVTERLSLPPMPKLETLDLSYMIGLTNVVFELFADNGSPQLAPAWPELYELNLAENSKLKTLLADFRGPVQFPKLKKVDFSNCWRANLQTLARLGHIASKLEEIEATGLPLAFSGIVRNHTRTSSEPPVIFGLVSDIIWETKRAAEAEHHL